PSASSAIHSLRAIYLMDGSGKRAIYTSGGLPGWTLLYDEVDLSLRDSPGYQTLFVVPVKSWDALPGAVEPNPKIPPRLQGMAVGPDPSVCPRSVLTALRKRGLSRVCAPGELQSPPLDWTHDGNPFFPLKLTSDPSKSMERS
ncbi:hypothetical protein HYR69_01815, partial [Candidatus Sumerlaeota bacterium]|nr:hypothetical protein [Candidatus Sumerlaeota bacterium]